MLYAKKFFQTLWNKKRTWDNLLDSKEVNEWSQITDLWRNKSIILPRRVIESVPSTVELHVFVDASKDGYAAVVYLRTVCHYQFTSCLKPYQFQH